MRWAIVLHGGAGEWAVSDEEAVQTGMGLALERAAEQLAAGGSALDAAIAAAVVLEDDPLFNAGTGSALNADGEAEMDAAVMTGHDLACGGVAALRRVRNPVLVARRVMERTPHVLLAGEGALRFARDQGFTDYDPVTPRARRTWERRLAARSGGTIGALALDRTGRLAAVTSTGGLMLKLPGRIGDSPIPGAGNYATAGAACSATGQGELMMRVLAAKSLCDRVAAGEPAQAAAHAQLGAMADSVGADGGFIVLSARADIGVVHATASMPHAWRIEGEPQATVRMRA